MEHSRLLKFFLPETVIIEMAEPTKIKFDYQNPENVEAEVPGAQKIREATHESSSNDENTAENGESSPNNGFNSKDDPENGERIVVTSTEVRTIGEEDDMVLTRHRQVITTKKKRNGIHGTPVLLDEKLEDKTSKTRIPVSKFRQTVERVNAERRGSKDKNEHESHIPVRRTSIPKSIKDHNLPPTTGKKEITVTKTEIRKETSKPTVTKTVITQKSFEPEDEFDKIYAEIVTTPTGIVLDDSLLNPKVEDPEKLESEFEEIIHDYDDHKIEPIDVDVVKRSKIPFLKRRSQQEIELSAQAERTSKIIAARDKLRMRRNSLTKSGNFEEELDKELRRSQDNLCTDTYVSKSIVAPVVKTEKEVKEEKISSKTPNSKTEVTRHFTTTISTSSSKESEDLGSSSIVETRTVKEVTSNESNDKKENKQHITEENVIKDSIKIGIPVFDSYIHEFSENNETLKTVEVKRVMSYTSKNEDISVKNNVTKVFNETVYTGSQSLETNRQISKDVKTETNYSKNVDYERHISENNENKVNLMNSENNKIENEITTDKLKTSNFKCNENNNEDEVQLRNKVGRIPCKTESKELIETDTNKRESINELTKKKSVLSKIAMFERKETDESLKANSPKRDTKPPNLIIKELKKADHGHVHTPLIVDEFFKPFQADIDINNKENAEEIPPKNNYVATEIEKEEFVTLENPESVQYSVETLVQENKIAKDIPAQSNADSEFAIQKVEIATITDIQTNKATEDLPLPRSTTKELNQTEFKEIIPRVDNSTKLNLTKEIQAPVIIPEFKPVSELLRSFELKKQSQKSLPKRTISKIENTSIVTKKEPTKHTSVVVASPAKTTEIMRVRESIASTTEISYSEPYSNENYDNFESVNDYKSLDDVFTREYDYENHKLGQEDLMRAKSLAELNLGDAFKGKVNSILTRMTSLNRIEIDRKEVINKKEMPRKRSVSEKIALFEGKFTPSSESPTPLRIFKSEIARIEKLRTEKKIEKSRVETNRYTREVIRENVDTTKKVVEAGRSEKNDEEWVKKTIEELSNAKLKYGKVDNMPTFELSNGIEMPVLAVGTALLDPRVTYHVVTAAIDLGYRAIDSGYIYGNEQLVGEAIRAKIADGTVKREDLFVINKLWSTYHRTDLVEEACRTSLKAMGLDYFDLYLIHNPMSFKEGKGPVPKIAMVIQYSEHDYLDAWYGMEQLVTKGLARGIGVSNFNSVQLQRVLDKGRIKPIINQVECHPYLSQQRLDLFCSERNVTLSCFGVLGAKGTPTDLTSGQPAAIDDALVQVMASGLEITPGQLLVSYQLENGHGVVVKSSSAAHLWDNLQALRVHLTTGQVDALHALNRNKRIYIFKGMGDTHKNYPFNISF